MGRPSLTRRLLCVAAFTAASAVLPAHAAASSLVYIKDGNVWLAAPDGTRQTQLTTDGGYESPSQANDGTVVAVRRTDEGQPVRRIHRMNRAGVLLNPPVETVSPTNSNLVGPHGAEVSPDGRLVAYHYFNNGVAANMGRPRLAFSYSDRNTSPDEIYNQGWYTNPTWIDGDRAIAFTTGTSTYDSQIYSISGGALTDWDEEPDGKLGSGDLSADGGRFAATLTTDGGESRIRLYSPAALPPGQPTARCDITGANGGTFTSPTWSPDGSTLAWEEGDGIHVAAVNSLDPCAMAASPTALIPGGSVPFWGPADAPAPTGGGGGGVDATPPLISVTVAKARLAKALKSGFTVKVTTSEAGKALVQALVSGKDAKLLRVRSKVAAKGSRTLPAAGSHAIRVRFTKAAKRKFRRHRRLALSIRTHVTDAAGNRATRSKKVVFKR